MAFSWNSHNEQHLREMWAKGCSASRIADLLAAKIAANPQPTSTVSVPNQSSDSDISREREGEGE